jgi:tetratricopeptide (TPR) repeat protein
MSQGDDHYSAESLEQFLLGTLSADQTRAVIGHLARGCPRCHRIMAPIAVLVLGGEPLPLAAEVRPRGPEYDTAIARSIRRARNGAGILTRPARRGQAGVDLCRALLAQSDALRHEDPHAMIRYAELACSVAENLPADRYGSLAIFDLQALALAELANAHRVADELEAAEGLMLRALRRAEGGTGDTFLLARLLDLAASFASERRRFGEALVLLDAAHVLYAERGDTRRAGRALLSKGLYAGYRGDHEQGLRLLLEGLRWIDPERDRELVVSAVHNLLWILADDGRIAEAARLLELAWPVCDGALNRLKRRWLEGRIAAGRGDLAAAVAVLSEVRAAFRAAGLGYCEAQVGLDLAAACLQQGDADAAYRLLGGVIAAFSALRIGRDGAAALLLLAEATERRRLSAALLDSVILAVGGPATRPVAGR